MTDADHEPARPRAAAPRRGAARGRRDRAVPVDRRRAPSPAGPRTSSTGGTRSRRARANLMTVHLTSTVRMGDDQSRTGADSFGRVWGYREPADQRRVAAPRRARREPPGRDHDHRRPQRRRVPHPTSDPRLVSACSLRPVQGAVSHVAPRTSLGEALDELEGAELGRRTGGRSPSMPPSSWRWARNHS